MPRQVRLAPANPFVFHPYGRSFVMSSAASYPNYYQSHDQLGATSLQNAVGQGRTSATTWTPEDDSNLIHGRQQGLSWQAISAGIFPAKTPNACRKRHERLMERSNADEWDGVKLDLLAATYFEVRQQMWSIMARRLNEKWTVLEQKCMAQGLKNLNTAARSASRRSIGTDDSGIGLDDAEQGLDPGPLVGEGSSGAAAAAAAAAAMAHAQVAPQSFYTHHQPHHHQHHQNDSFVTSHHHSLQTMPPPVAIRPTCSGPSIESLLVRPNGPP